MQKFSNFEALSKINEQKSRCHSIIIKTDDITTGTPRDTLYIHLGGYHPWRPRGSHAVGPEEKVRQKFSSAGERVPG